MVLVDTSIWIDHFRKGVPSLSELLNTTSVATHPFIIGELACGSLKNRKEILELLHTLSMSPVISTEEYLEFIELKDLSGKGIGFVDIHLLASSVLSGYPLWTNDKKLRLIADQMDISFYP